MRSVGRVSPLTQFSVSRSNSDVLTPVAVMLNLLPKLVKKLEASETA